VRPRNLDLERELVELAARSAGFYDVHGNGDPAGIDDFADRRALPGGVRIGLDPEREALEELADARNYLVWGCERDYQAYLDGDAVAGDRVRRRLEALSGVLRAWHALV
jgi:hypothetical protein